MAAAAIIAGVGAATQAIGAIKQGQAAKAAGDYNQAVATQNAELAVQQGTEESRRYRIQARKQIGDMRANYGASGVTLEGSPLDYLEESASTAELDALTIEHQGAVKASGYTNEGVQSEYSGSQALKGAYFSASGSLLSGAGQAMSYGKSSAPKAS